MHKNRSYNNSTLGKLKYFHLWQQKVIFFKTEGIRNPTIMLKLVKC